MVLGSKTAGTLGNTVRAFAIGAGSVAGDWLQKLSAPEREAAALIDALRRDDGCGVPPDRLDRR